MPSPIAGQNFRIDNSNLENAMHTSSLALTKPDSDKYIEMIEAALSSVAPSHVEIAIAYATHSGVAVLTSALAESASWRKAHKRWLVGIDYCRSDPVALQHLQQLPRSEVRIYDGDYVVKRSECTPRISYHPKLYLFRRQKKSALILGSGNLSRTGLEIGVEAGASILVTRAEDIRPIQKWFSSLWRNACPWQEVKESYSAQYLSRNNRQSPIVLEDDMVPGSAIKSGQLTPRQLRQLRVCQHLWIEAGNLHKNLGADSPGNQLMLKRNTRVFFGFAAQDLQRDSRIGSIEIEFNGQTRYDCSLRFSNNHMDVLTLPIPGMDGPTKYDQETLCFTRTGLYKFSLELGTNLDVSRWKRKSRAINGLFEMKRGRKMKKGRKWGVY